MHYLNENLTSSKLLLYMYIKITVTSIMCEELLFSLCTILVWIELTGIWVCFGCILWSWSKNNQIQSMYLVSTKSVVICKQACSTLSHILIIFHSVNCHMKFIEFLTLLIDSLLGEMLKLFLDLNLIYASYIHSVLLGFFLVLQNFLRLFNF